MSLSQKVAFNAAAQILSKIITVLFSLLTTILLTRYLGRNGYGEYMYVVTLVVLIGAFADWGTSTIGVREAAKEKEKQGRILGNLIIIRLCLALFAGLIMAGLAFLAPLRLSDPSLVRKGILIGILILILYATKASFGVIFQTNLRLEKLAIADTLSSFLILSFSWLFIRWNLGLLPLLGALVVAAAVGVGITAFFARKVVKLDFRLDKNLIKKLIIESLPMGAVLMLFTVDNKIDTVMLGSIKGSSAVGIYALAYKVYDVLILGAAYLMNALLPVLSQLSDPQRRGQLRMIYQKTYDILLILGIGVGAMVLIFSPLIVKVLTQERYLEFTDAGGILRVLTLALFFAYFNHLTGYTIVALGKQRPYFFVAFSALFINVLANVIVIPRWSYWGAAWVTVFTEGLVLIITSLFIFRLLRLIPSISSFPKTIVQLIKQRGKIF